MVLGCAAFAEVPFRKVRQKMADSLNSMPEFTCSVSIERTTAKGPAATYPPLRVNAGIINGKELYLLPPTVDEQDILRSVLSLYNRVGTGTFAMYARGLFLTTEATYYDGPDETKDGRTLSRLDFAMPREASHHALNIAGRQIELGYSGSIWTDPRNLEVARVLLQTDNMPQDLDIKAVTQTIDYGKVPILGVAVLLPLGTDLTVLETSGRELRLTARFSECHAFDQKRGDRFVENGVETPVTVSAASPAPAAATLTSVSLPLSRLPSFDELLPVRTRFEMMLEDPIDERITTEKSKLSFTVSRDVRKDGQVVLPIGAKATGHITRILRQAYPFETGMKGYYLIGFQLDTIDVGDRRFRLTANLEDVGPPAKQIGFVPLSVDPYRFGQFDDRQTLFIVPTAERGESFLGIVSEFLRLGGHWKTYWTVRATK